MLYLVEPYSFRSWFDIETLEAALYDLEVGDSFETQAENFDEMDPLEPDDDASGASKKKKKKN